MSNRKRSDGCQEFGNAVEKGFIWKRRVWGKSFFRSCTAAGIAKITWKSPAVGTSQRFLSAVWIEAPRELANTTGISFTLEEGPKILSELAAAYRNLKFSIGAWMLMIELWEDTGKARNEWGTKYWDFPDNQAQWFRCRILALKTSAWWSVPYRGDCFWAGIIMTHWVILFRLILLFSRQPFNELFSVKIGCYKLQRSSSLSL